VIDSQLALGLLVPRHRFFFLRDWFIRKDFRIRLDIIVEAIAELLAGADLCAREMHLRQQPRGVRADS
jgi:hypothetical protein